MRKFIAVAMIVIGLFAAEGCGAPDIVETKNKASEAVEKYNDSIKERSTFVEE